MISLTETSDYIRLEVDDNHIIGLSFQGNRAILDLPDKVFSRREREKVLAELEKYLHKDNALVSMSLSEKISYVIESRKFSPVFPSDVEVLTMVNDEVISITLVDLTGDIRYHSVINIAPENREFISQLHQITIQVLMRKWRESLIQTREIISSLVDTISKMQLYSGVIGSLSLLSGVVMDTPRYLMFSVIPFLFTGILALVKRTI